MAYLGESTWIEADPDEGQVLKVAIPNRDRRWFNIPVHVMRWRIDEGGGGGGEDGFGQRRLASPSGLCAATR